MDTNADCCSVVTDGFSIALGDGSRGVSCAVCRRVFCRISRLKSHHIGAVNDVCGVITRGTVSYERE
jgi:hypothetical protein